MRLIRPKSPPRRVVAVDVDGTLHRNGVPSLKVIERLRELKAEGYELFLWSARGERYASAVAADLGISDLFTHVLTKPGYIVDDKGWDWVRFTRRIPLDRSAERADG